MTEDSDEYYDSDEGHKILTVNKLTVKAINNDQKAAIISDHRLSPKQNKTTSTDNYHDQSSYTFNGKEYCNYLGLVHVIHRKLSNDKYEIYSYYNRSKKEVVDKSKLRCITADNIEFISKMEDGNRKIAEIQKFRTGSEGSELNDVTSDHEDWKLKWINSCACPCWACGVGGCLIAFILLLKCIMAINYFDDYAANAVESKCIVDYYVVFDCEYTCGGGRGGTNYCSGTDIYVYATAGANNSESCDGKELKNEVDYTCKDDHGGWISKMDGVQTCYILDCETFSFRNYSDDIDDWWLGLGFSIAGVVFCPIVIIVSCKIYFKW